MERKVSIFLYMLHAPRALSKDHGLGFSHFNIYYADISSKMRVEIIDLKFLF